MNVVMFVALLTVAVFGLAAAYDPRLAKWVASVAYSRAVAVEAARAAYRSARRRGIACREAE